MTTGKTMWIFVGKVMSLLFNMLSRLVITFLPRSKCLNFIAAVTVHSNFGAQENKICHCFHFLPFYLPSRDETECRDLSFVNVEFRPAFSLSSFTLIKRFFQSSSLSATGVIYSAFLRWLIFLLAVLIPACDSFSLAFCMM